MKRNTLRVLTCVLGIAALFTLPAVPAMALSWDGSSTGGIGNTTSAGVNGYAIRTDADNCIAYRFSVVDKSGNTKNGAVIDVFRNTSYGNYEYTYGYKFNVKYNKMQLISNQNAGFSTSRNTVNCYLEANMGFAAAMPGASGMSTWQNDGRNLDPILRKLGIAGIVALKNGDKILVEPLYDLRLESVYHAVTLTEAAIYGKHILGAYSDGGFSWNSGSWGFIANYTNKHYPNELYTPDGQGLWPGVSALSSRATFYTIINKGYGVGIAYTETKPDFTPNLFVDRCEAWPGSVSARNNDSYGISRGSAFANWSYGHGYPVSGSSIWYAVYFPAEAENCYVKQSVWVVGGGTASRTVWSNSNTCYEVALSPTAIPSSSSYLTVIARADWVESSGAVKKYGTEKTFYIPIRPLVYRAQVSMTDYAGKTAAYSGPSGSGGSVYVGQKVYASYEFSSGNSWTSYNSLYGAMHTWNGSDWVCVKTDGNQADCAKPNSALSSAQSQTVVSELGYIRVPNTGATRIPFKMTTKWSPDGAHTGESTWFDIPVIKADAALTNIRLIGENGSYLDPAKLEAGERVTVQYTYKNNSAVTIYVNGYNSDKSQIAGVYAMEPNRSILVNSSSFEVPNVRRFQIWGGVYLEGAVRGDTAWEAVGTNNELTLQCEVNHPLSIYPISPNAPYREGTEVISSFWVLNGCRDEYTPADQVAAQFQIEQPDGTIICKYTVPNVAVPAKDKNLVYFKWSVPTGLHCSDIRITANIVEDGKAYSAYTRWYSIIPYTISEPPDTQFEEAVPSGFTAPAAPTASAGNAVWWEYKYGNGSFVKHTYGVGILNDCENEITPVAGASAYQSGSDWSMKSGYAFSIQIFRCAASLAGYEIAPYSAYTAIQYAYATFPEYNYAATAGKCRTLEKGGHGIYYEFRENGSYGKDRNIEPERSFER